MYRYIYYHGDICMYVWMDGWMDGCIYIYIYIYIPGAEPWVIIINTDYDYSW